MYRILIILFLLPFQSFAHRYGVSDVNEFLRRNQSILEMQRVGSPNSPKWPRSISTLSKPLGTNLVPTYQPQKITKESFMRGTFNALSRRHPAVLTALSAGLLAAEVYQCVTSESGWCVGGRDPQPKCPDGGQLTNHYNSNVCFVPAPTGQMFSATSNSQPISRTGPSRQKAVEAYISAVNALPSFQLEVTESPNSFDCWDIIEFKRTASARLNQDGTYDFVLLQNQKVSQQYRGNATTITCAPPRNTITQQVVPLYLKQLDEDFYCPSDTFPKLSQLGTNSSGSKICYAPAYEKPAEPQRPFTLSDYQAIFDDSPIAAAVNNIPDSAMFDPQTGKPDSTFLDNPRSTPISQPLSDALVAVARGENQSSNPSAPNYIPPEIAQQVVDIRKKFHDGEPFIDPYTNTSVTPQPQPSDPKPFEPQPDQKITVDAKVSWDDFPGLTQSQYEQSNDKLATAVDTLQIPDPAKPNNEFLDTLKQNPDLPFNPIRFDSFWPISGGQCRGFNIEMSVAGDVRNVLMDKHCPPYNEWAHPLIAWFLQLLTILHIFHIFSRMINKG